jgi:hypothetical protein
MSKQQFRPLVKSEHDTKRDAALQIVRRIDWRFLLPNPHLGRVAYMGLSGDALSGALSQFSESLTLIAPIDQVKHTQSNLFDFELVVIRSQRVADAARAHTMLMNGGHLYWEIDRFGGLLPLHRSMRGEGWQTRWALHSLRHYLRALERLGFCNIGIYWHRPSFENCQEMIPLQEQSVLTYVFWRKREGLAASIARAVGHLPLKTGWLSRLIPCLSIVACKHVVSGAMM